jgi:AcrR family transcriptional regulator
VNGLNKAESKYYNTAVRIDEAFISLLDTKDFDFITVKEICEKAGVNRSTFYLHYETIGDLLRESIEYLNKKCFDSFPAETVESQMDSCSIEELILIQPKYLVPYLEFIKENKVLFRTAVTKSAVLSGDKTFGHISGTVIAPIMAKFHYAPDEIGYITAFYLNGLISLVMEWVKNDCKEDIPKIIGIIKKVIFPTTHDALSPEQIASFIQSSDTDSHSEGVPE